MKKFENKGGKIIRIKPKSNFTQIPNKVLQNKELSWKAKGLLGCILSMHDNWVVYKTTLHQFSSDGRDSTITAFNELIKHNYIKQFNQRSSNGRFADVFYYVSPIPFTELPNSLIPNSDNPKSVNPQLINNKGLNTESLNNEFIKDCTSISSRTQMNTIDLESAFDEINEVSSYRHSIKPLK
jgi:hypothetical protein